MGHRLDELTARIETLETDLAQLKTLAAQLTAATEAAPAQSPDTPSASRRDLLRYGAVALGAAAGAVGMTAAPARAANGDPVVIGAGNTGSSATVLTTSFGHGFWSTAAASGYVALYGEAQSYGVSGIASQPFGVGVYGTSTSSTGMSVGVVGVASSPTGAGIHGIHYNGGNAVRAEVPSGSTSNAIALYALNYSAYAGPGPGAGGFAIYGLSAKGHGLVGATAAAGAAAVVGATNGVAGAYAAAFYGPVIVSGNFTVVGGAKSAAVPHPDGSHRRLYCVESPESWFEDFGRATLICGEAVVPLDRDFAAVVDTSDYHVFLTANDGPSDLLACDRTSEGFRVKATTAAGDGTFSWRVVAKRKDIAGARFETVEIPKEPTLPPVPASATATERPPMPPLPGRPKSRA